jgi:hypothetical protein
MEVKTRKLLSWNMNGFRDALGTSVSGEGKLNLPTLSTEKYLHEKFPKNASFVIGLLGTIFLRMHGAFPLYRRT